MLDIKAANKKTYVLLTLVLFLGLMVRLPGIFWGFHFFSGSSFTSYHGDERRQVNICDEFLKKRINQKENHPKCFGFQIFLTTFISKPFTQTDMPGLILTGRALSLMYAILSIFLLYFLSYEIFKCQYTALFSSLFLALSGLHVTESHYATVDASTTFWVYATMYSSLLYCRQHKPIYFIFAVVSAGLAIALKLFYPVLMVLFYSLYKQKVKFTYSLLCLAGIFVVFIAANGGHYTLNNFKLTLRDVIYSSNFCVYQHHQRFGNLPVYFLWLVSFLGLANFVFLLTGVLALKKELRLRTLNKDIFFIFILPLTLYGLSICFLDIAPSWYFLPLVPGLVMLAAYGINKIKNVLSKLHFSIVLTIGILYQLVYVMGTEYYYIFDTREDAHEWIMENVPKGKAIHLGPYAMIPDLDQYKLLKGYGADYVVLNEMGYSRYLPSNIHDLNGYPVLKDIYHGDPLDLMEIQKIFKGKSDFTLVKSFPIIYYTPENILYKKLYGTYSSFVGDTLIFQRK